jgi:dTDP-4-amino-4,6-dideoxygalactose transaminase
MKPIVPYTDLGHQAAPLKKQLLSAVEKVIDGGNFILGSNVTEFEKDFARYCQTEYATGLANGTCALHLVLRGMGLEAGDEVITAPNSFIASAASIDLAGAKVVFSDVREDLNMDPEKLEAAITPKTKAIMPVHLTGRPAPMKEIMEIAKKHKLFVLEDAAQALGASLNGKRVGSFGDAACFSLHPLKNLFAYGDAGMMTTPRKDIYEKMIKSRTHGLINRNECEFFSFNCRLDEMQAAMLKVNMAHLEEWTAKRRELAFAYNKKLKPYVEVPEEGPGEFCVYQTYAIKADRRDELLKFLNETGVDAKVHYPIPIHMQQAAKHLHYKSTDFPVTMKLANRIMSLPLYPTLTTEQQDLVVEQIRKFYAR